jgi:CRISPR type III-B/RAMP module RAMP protein Cmr1
MIAFINVKLITPAMIGGANPRACDKPLSLRPTEIRGMLRFWTRALAHGAGKNLNAIESEFFGNTEKGQRIRILPALIKSHIERLELFPHKEIPGAKVRSEMIMPGDEIIQIRFAIPNDVQIDLFKSVLWAWLHLGSIGRRSRRGYGSLLWLPSADDLPSNFMSFNHAEDLFEKRSLENYLTRGLAKVEKIWKTPKTNDPRTRSDIFQLAVFDQIFVGKSLINPLGIPAQFVNKKDEMQHKIHGLDFGKRSIDPNKSKNIGKSDEEKEMGYAQNHQRLASRMLWRLFPCSGGFIPVMTWSPKYVAKLTAGTNMHNYLANKLGFQNSLAGKPL